MRIASNENACVAIVSTTTAATSSRAPPSFVLAAARPARRGRRRPGHRCPGTPWGSEATNPNNRGCSRQHRDIGQAVAAESDAGRPVEDHLARIVAGAVPPPVRQRGPQPGTETGRPRGVGQQLAGGERHQPLTVAGDFHPAATSVTLHVRSAFPFGLPTGLDNQQFPLPNRHFRAFPARVGLIDQRLGESARLVHWGPSSRTAVSTKTPHLSRLSSTTNVRGLARRGRRVQPREDLFARANASETRLDPHEGLFDWIAARSKFNFRGGAALTNSGPT